MRRLARVVIPTLLLGFAALLAHAQSAGAQTLLPGIPSGPIHTGTGITVSLDGSDSEDSDELTWGLSAGAGFSRFGLMGGFGSFSEQTSYGAGGAMRLFGGGTGPIEVSTQLSAWSVDLGKQVSAVNPGIAAKFSVFAIPLKPWAVVYYQFADNVDDQLRTALGADFNFFPGLGIHAGYDFGESRDTWGLGAHFQFGVPGE